MAWLWGSKTPPPSPSTDTGTDTDSDPLRDLDPNLRAFLDSKTPPTQPPPPAPTPAPPPATEPDTSPKVPPQSLYPDGRYAHLWSTYTPYREIEVKYQSDQDKVLEVIDTYKERKAQIGRTALENCAMEQTALDHCFKTGGWMSRMTMCRTENQAVARCYTMQSRFLQALGYRSTEGSTPAQNEEIQMHADLLYHRMLARERAVEAAQAAGEPVPTFPPLLSSSSAPPPSRPAPSSSPAPPEPPSMLTDSTSTAAPEPPAAVPPTEDDHDPLKASARAALTEKLKKLPTAEERELEERAVTMEAWAGMRTATDLTRLHETQVKAREERRQKGTATFSDTINKWFGF
ncbi:hypothetical protein MMC07_005782 [Pseudocyphellaria aurata]|nr:hypothetical protein [Pseudocyphellaria aurata]